MPEEFRILWTENALSDLGGVTDFIAVDSPRAADSVADRIEDACSALRRFPARCKVVPELRESEGEKYRELVVKPYVILIRIEENTVYVLGVFDGRRDLEDVLHRRVLGQV